MKEKIGNVILNLDYYNGEDLYSDGSIEDVLLDIVKNHDSSEFNDIIREKKDWAVTYHLSEYRHNIINWYDIRKDMNVLEIGSGCGAITGILAQLSKKVVCVELSRKRSTINAERNKKYDNIEILVGNFQDIEPHIEESFDIITLIGVFEYSALYIDSENPYAEFLRIIRRHLKKGGKLILAIENKLGMKYWAGCKEDHVGKYYESIEGYPDSDKVMTFGKKELEDIIKTVGFSKYKFYYPYPDYKFTEKIYSDEYLPKEGELISNTRNLDNSRIVTFDEGKAFDSVIKNDLFPQYSNSFLLEITK